MADGKRAGFDRWSVGRAAVEDGTLCRSESPRPGPLGTSNNRSPVASWDAPRKLLVAAERAAPLLPVESRAQFASLFSPANLAITTGVLSIWAGSHFFGAGEFADGAILIVALGTAGWQAMGAARNLGNYLATAMRAQSEADLNAAAEYLARAVIAAGITAFIILISRAGSRLGMGGIQVRSVAGERLPLAPSGESAGPWWKAYSFGEDWWGTTVPRGFTMETGGQVFRVTANATKHMAEGSVRNYPLSSLAGALEQAAQEYRSLPPQRFEFTEFGNWELGIDTRSNPWLVEHAIPKGK